MWACDNLLGYIYAWEMAAMADARNKARQCMLACRPGELSCPVLQGWHTSERNWHLLRVLCDEWGNFR